MEMDSILKNKTDWLILSSSPACLGKSLKLNQYNYGLYFL